MGGIGLSPQSQFIFELLFRTPELQVPWEQLLWVLSTELPQAVQDKLMHLLMLTSSSVASQPLKSHYQQASKWGQKGQRQFIPTKMLV